MEHKYLTVIGDVETRLGVLDAIYFILAFKSKKDRRKAERIMFEHRRDDEEISDTENMLNALDESKIEYEIFEDISECWF